MIKRKYVLLVLLFIVAPMSLWADGGLWFPHLVKGDIHDKLKSNGIKLSDSEIYSVNKACIKDAILSLSLDNEEFTPYASASFISSKGLVVTNFHCILSQLGKLSTLERNFVEDGHWSTKIEDETPIPGLQINQLLRMEDVTAALQSGMDTLSIDARSKVLEKRVVQLVNDAVNNDPFLKARIYSVFGNSQYILAVYKVFKDVRLVAAPSIKLGKFGGDEDNWRWPRQVADFAFLRVYANDDNQPSSFAKENKPYNPTSHLSISLKGVKENDPIMVWGYPAQTHFYIPSFVLEKKVFGETNLKNDFYKAQLNVLDKAMKQDETLKLKYTSLHSSLMNAYLKGLGEIRGVESMELLSLKKKEEAEFNQWIASGGNKTVAYRRVLDKMEELYNTLSVYNMAQVCLSQMTQQGAEIIPFAGKFEKLVAMSKRKNINKEALKREAVNLQSLATSFYANWHKETDNAVFISSYLLYLRKIPQALLKADQTLLIQKYSDDELSMSFQNLLDNSILTKQDSVLHLLKGDPADLVSRLSSDSLYNLIIGFYSFRISNIMPVQNRLQKENAQLYSLYLQGLKEYNPSSLLNADANKTMRFSYGKVAGCEPEDGLTYKYYTTLDGAVNKAILHKGSYDYRFPKRLAELNEKRDFGIYGDKDLTMHVCFMTNAQTSSGSSGSAVLNARGELIGLNFDRTWQGLASNYRYDASLTRNIVVDIRYVLFLIDKYSSSRYILNELDIVPT